MARVTLEDLVRQPPGSVQTLQPQVDWLPKPWFVRYQADPCLLEDGGRVFIYYEEVPFGSSKGRLRAGRVPRRRNGPTRRAYDPFAPSRRLPIRVQAWGHASTAPPRWPQVGASFSFPAETPVGPWSRHSVLLQGVQALDSTVFFFGDRWWLLLYGELRAAEGTGGTWITDNLYIWHGPEPWGPWEPHRLQPAKEDLRSARPAGRPFVVDDVLFRPAQDCWPWYGARVVINRIITLTPMTSSRSRAATWSPSK